MLAMGTDDYGNATDGEHPLNNTIHRCMFREVGVFAKHSGAYAEFVAGAVTITDSIIMNGPVLVMKHMCNKSSSLFQKWRKIWIPYAQGVWRRLFLPSPKGAGGQNTS